MWYDGIMINDAVSTDGEKEDGREKTYFAKRAYKDDDQYQWGNHADPGIDIVCYCISAGHSKSPGRYGLLYGKCPGTIGEAIAISGNYGGLY